MNIKTILLVPFILLAACEPAVDQESLNQTGLRFEMVGKLESKHLDEASGIQAGENGVFFLHNDDGHVIYAIDSSGRDLGRMKIDDAVNKDWEDITRVMDEDGPLLVIADTGDNSQGRKKVRLYFVREPAAEDLDNKLDLVHRLNVTYEDGPRDVEAVSYDPASDMILFLSKRDTPPRLYGIPMDLARWESKLEARFLAEVPGFRPPTRSDILGNPKRGLWVSQPTGMDISRDGRTAAVITYRSLYVFQREDNETWAEAFQRAPIEHHGPPGLHDEAVAFNTEGDYIYVATERRPAPLHRIKTEANTTD